MGEYQRLLLEHGEESVEGGRIFELARNAIAAILAAVGRDAYAPYEKSASAQLAEAPQKSTSPACARRRVSTRAKARPAATTATARL